MIADKSELQLFRRKLISALDGREEVCFAILYGSAAEGLPFHDLDVAVYANRDQLPATADIDYALSLSDTLQAVVDYPVDVRVINDAPLLFCYNVSRGLPLVIHNESLFYQFLERTWDEYLDFEPVAIQYLKEMI